MPSTYHRGEIAIQERAGVREIANDVGEGIIDFVPPDAASFLARRPLAVLGSVDRGGRVWASVITGAPGFIKVIDERTLKLEARLSPGDPLVANLANEGHVAMFAPDFVAARRVRINGRGLIKDGAIYVRTEQVYGNCRRYLQERMIAGDRPGPAGESVRSVGLSRAQQEQISRADTFFIATDHPDAGADVSHKGGNPGFVRVIDEHRLAFPDYNGNSMFNTLGNIAVNAHAGLLFIDFESGRTLQLTGDASVDWDQERASEYVGAERVVDFKIAEIVDTPNGFPLIARFRQFSKYNPHA
jgi:uncharacterized protein